MQMIGDDVLVNGGEWTDGSTTRFFRDTLRFNAGKHAWRSVRGGRSPRPRSSHQSVLLGMHIYIFGGEFGSSRESHFVHFRDLWRFDTRTNAWEEIEAPNGPAARSGHRMAAVRERIFVFGGFQSDGTSIQYLDDLWSFDTKEFTWTRHNCPNGPTARSAFQFRALSDGRILLYGGYCVEKAMPSASKKSAAPKVLADLWMFDARATKWELKKRSADPLMPARSGASSFVWRDRLYVFGGVVDEETPDGFLCGRCLRDVHEYNPERNSWRAVEVAGMDALCPRYNAAVAISGNTAVIYGGIFEAGDNLVILDDMHCLQMDKMATSCLVPLSVDTEIHQESTDSQASGSTGDSESSSDESSTTASSDSSTIASGDAEASKESEHPRPVPGQGLKDYFASHIEHWKEQVHSQGDAKSTRAEAFRLAQAHFTTCSLDTFEL